MNLGQMYFWTIPNLFVVDLTFEEEEKTILPLLASVLYFPGESLFALD
jgi:hypothetical protein